MLMKREKISKSKKDINNFFENDIWLNAVLRIITASGVECRCWPWPKGVKKKIMQEPYKNECDLQLKN